VRRGGASGGAGSSDALPRLHRLARLDGQRCQLHVLAVPAVVVQEDDLVAVRSAPACEDDTSDSDLLDLGPDRDGEVDAGVAFAPGAAGLVIAD
jgi:hypothetical protein